jgi:hypothetical protein
MYSGTTFRRDSGLIVGVHQKIDRVARKHLKKLIKKSDFFPSISQILHFEGLGGPDGIKRKSPSKDEPWHYIDPANPSDRGLIVLINDHIFNLAEALRLQNETRAAFEAAWLAHAVVDGLTPAHHYPVGSKIEELWGKPHDERSTVIDKNIIKGNSYRDTISKNWQYWGAGGMFTAHYMYEWGVASAIASERFKESAPSSKDIRNVTKQGFEEVFMASLYKIDARKMYDEFCTSGWTRSLAKETRNILIPEIVRMVCLAWYCAIDLSRTDGR